MLQKAGSDKSGSGSQTKGKCNGEVTTDNSKQGKHPNIPKGTPYESYPSTIYCRACQADKPLSDYSFKSNGQIKSLLCTEHHNELKAAKLSEDYKRIAELENIEHACDNCGGVVLYHRFTFALNNYQKLSKCTTCRAIKVSKNIPLDFMAWAKLMPVQTIPQKTIPQTKVSEYHKNIERTDTNTRFLNWLCSGSNIEFR